MRWKVLLKLLLMLVILLLLLNEGVRHGIGIVDDDGLRLRLRRRRRGIRRPDWPWKLLMSEIEYSESGGLYSLAVPTSFCCRYRGCDDYIVEMGD